MKRLFNISLMAMILVLTLNSTQTVQALTLGFGQPAASVLGQTNFTASVSATSQKGMSGASDVAVDPTTGKVFVADRSNNRVLRFASAASLTNGGAAEAVLGQANFTSLSPSTTQSGMNSPIGVAVDYAGTLWVGDQSNNRVLRFDHASSKINGSLADGVLGQSSFTTNTPATTNGGMDIPSGVAVDSSGTLWVSDYNNSRILRYANAAAKSNGGLADGVLGQADFVSRTQAHTQNGMSFPFGVAIDSSGRLWVSDTLNSRVLRFDNAASKANGANADGVLGQGDFTSNSGTTSQSGMTEPEGVTVDASGRLWVADTLNNRVLGFDNAASLSPGANANEVLGQVNFSGSSSASSSTGFNFPMGVFYEPARDILWVADYSNNRVLRFGMPPVNGQAAAMVLGQISFTTKACSSSVPTSASLCLPASIAVDPTTGKVFVSDPGHSRVLRFASVAMLSNGAAAEGVLGQPDFTSHTFGLSQNTMDGPYGLAIDSNGTLWVVDNGNSRVLRFNLASSKANGANADGVLGEPDYVTRQTTSSPSQSTMFFPFGAAVDSSGTLWVSDEQNNRVLRFDNAASKSDGANADAVLGQSDFVSSGFLGAQNGLSFPLGLTVDTSGRLWVTDYGHNRIMRFDNAASKANGANADAVLGQPDFNTTTAATSANGLSAPSGVAVDTYGRLWVSDIHNNRVIGFVNAAGLPNGAAASIVIGQKSFTAKTAATSSSGLRNPEGVFYDPAAGILWVADYNNNRVLRYGKSVISVNGGFNSYSGSTPDHWVPTNFSGPDGIDTSVVEEGTASVGMIGGMTGGAGTVKTLTQTLPLSGTYSGVKSDSLVFSYWIKGAAIPTTTGLCEAQVELYSGATLKVTKTIPCATGTYGFTYKTLTFTAGTAYTQAQIVLTYSKTTGTVWFDAIGLMK